MPTPTTPIGARVFTINRKLIHTIPTDTVGKFTTAAAEQIATKDKASPNYKGGRMYWVNLHRSDGAIVSPKRQWSTLRTDIEYYTTAGCIK